MSKQTVPTSGPRPRDLRTALTGYPARPGVQRPGLTGERKG